MLEAVKARLQSKLPHLAGRIEGAASLAQVVEARSLPSAPIVVYAVPLALTGRRPDIAAGLFRQPVDEVLSLVLVMGVRSRTADGSLAEIRDTIFALIDALGGWAPDDQTSGVFALARAQLRSLTGGRIIYQIDFSLTNHLRITP